MEDVIDSITKQLKEVSTKLLEWSSDDLLPTQNAIRRLSAQIRVLCAIFDSKN